VLTKTKFDAIIAQNLIAHDVPLGYVVPETGRLYPHYRTNRDFEAFRKTMAADYPAAYTSYDEGKGSELKPRSHCGTPQPPKMASAASSSRFCYLALRSGAEALGGQGEVRFEEDCRITGVSGTAPQLDAFVPESNLYVEVKCHELFDNHAACMKIKYHPHLYGEGNAFGFPAAPAPDGEQFDVPFGSFGLKADSMFDVKQFLCHLLGIASRKHDSAELVYLFFRPESPKAKEQQEIDALFAALTQEITTLFASAPIRNFCAAHNISLRAVAERAPIMGPLTAQNLEILV
jgi:hypothetical protein